jgi:hypothetical protein
VLNGEHCTGDLRKAPYLSGSSSTYQTGAQPHFWGDEVARKRRNSAFAFHYGKRTDAAVAGARRAATQLALGAALGEAGET